MHNDADGLIDSKLISPTAVCTEASKPQVEVVGWPPRSRKCNMDVCAPAAFNDVHVHAIEQSADREQAKIRRAGAIIKTAPSKLEYACKNIGQVDVGLV